MCRSSLCVGIGLYKINLRRVRRVATEEPRRGGWHRDEPARAPGREITVSRDRAPVRTARRTRRSATFVIW